MSNLISFNKCEAKCKFRQNVIMIMVPTMMMIMNNFAFYSPLIIIVKCRSKAHYVNDEKKSVRRSRELHH